MCEEVVRRSDYVCNFKVIDQTLLMSPKSIVNCCRTDANWAATLTCRKQGAPVCTCYFTVPKINSLSGR